MYRPGCIDTIIGETTINTNKRVAFRCFPDNCQNVTMSDKNRRCPLDELQMNIVIRTSLNSDEDAARRTCKRALRGDRRDATAVRMRTGRHRGPEGAHRTGNLGVGGAGSLMRV